MFNALACIRMSGSSRTKRKRGRINSAYAELDEITVPPGDEYENWVLLSKDKLKERECNLMSLRLSSLRRAISEQCQVFVDNNAVTLLCAENVIGDEIASQCLNTLYPMLASWNGINLTKTTKSLDSFRRYFMVSKGWFDQKKKNMLGPNLWIPIFRALHQFTLNAASNAFHDYGDHDELQRLYAQHLLLQILCGVLEAQITFAERKQPLIPIVLFKECDAIKTFLVQIHCRLDIHRFVEGQITGNKTKTVGAKDIYRFLKHSVSDLVTSSYNEFQCKLKSLNDGRRRSDGTLNCPRYQMLGDSNPDISNQCDFAANSLIECSECTHFPMDSHFVSTTNQTLHNVVNDIDPKSTINIPPLRSSLMLPPLFVPPDPRTSGYALDKPLIEALPPILVPPLPIPNDLNLNNNLFSRHYNDRYTASRSTVSSMANSKSVTALRFDPMGHRYGECQSACSHCSASTPSMHSIQPNQWTDRKTVGPDGIYLDASCLIMY